MMLGGVKADISTRWERGDRVDEALREARLAYEIVSDNRMVAQVYLYTLSVAIHCAIVAGESPDALRQEADKIALQLEQKYPEYRQANADRAFYYMVVGDLDASEKAWAAASGDEDGGGITFRYAALLVQRGRQQEAIEVLNRFVPTTPLAKQAKACFVLGTPGGRREAQKLCADLIDNSLSKHAKLYALQTLCLLGNLGAVNREAKRFAEECADDDFHTWIDTWFEFFAAPEKLDEFRERCDDCPERRLQFHYNAAFYFLAIHDKDKARHHFEQCISQGVADGWTYWAMAYVKLLEDNPNWPYREDSEGAEPDRN
jgi:tetratricopeptide (TPR) repeat protein